MTSSVTPWRAEAFWWVAMSVVTVAAFLVGLGPVPAAIAGLVMFGQLAIISIGRRRSDAIRVVSGAGDERDRSLSTRAMSSAGTVTGLVIIGWWLLTVASGRPDQTLFTLVLLFSGSYFVAAAVHARAG